MERQAGRAVLLWLGVPRIFQRQRRGILVALDALARERALVPDELNRLAQRLAETDDLAEAERLKTAITRGFYGAAAHA